MTRPAILSEIVSYCFCLRLFTGNELIDIKLKQISPYVAVGPLKDQTYAVTAPLGVVNISLFS